VILINGVNMEPDNMAESVELLDDVLAKLVRAFPNIDVVTEDQRKLMTLVIATYLVDKADVDYGRDDFRDSNKFKIVISILAKALVKELNEKITVEYGLFESLFRSLMYSKFMHLFNNRGMMERILFGRQLPIEIIKLIDENKSLLTSFYKRVY